VKRVSNGVSSAVNLNAGVPPGGALLTNAQLIQQMSTGQDLTAQQQQILAQQRAFQQQLQTHKVEIVASKPDVVAVGVPDHLKVQTQAHVAKAKKDQDSVLLNGGGTTSKR